MKREMKKSPVANHSYREGKYTDDGIVEDTYSRMAGRPVAPFDLAFLVKPEYLVRFVDDFVAQHFRVCFSDAHEPSPSKIGFQCMRRIRSYGNSRENHDVRRKLRLVAHDEPCLCKSLRGDTTLHLDSSVSDHVRTSLIQPCVHVGLAPCYIKRITHSNLFSS